MEQEEQTSKCTPCCAPAKNFMKNGCGASSPLYFLGVVGAAVYYISHATTFWVGALGLLKAFAWPAFVVHGLMGMLFGS